MNSEMEERSFEHEEIAPKVVLKPASWLLNFEAIKALVFKNNVLFSLSGKEDSGKSTFAGLLIEALAPTIQTTFITTSPLFNRSSFLQQLGGLLQSSGEPSIEHFIEQSTENGKHTLVVIDDAHYLTMDFIEDILKALQKEGAQCFFHVCLVSSLALLPGLHQLAQQAYQDMVHTIDLGALNESETKTYVIQNMLPLPNAENIITDERVKEFYTLTEGRIVEINQRMAGFFSYHSSQHQPKTRSFRYVTMSLGIFLVATGMVYLWMSQGLMSPPAQFAQAEALMEAEEQPPAEIALNSVIPTYDLAATRQTLEVTSLQPLHLQAEEDDEIAPHETKALVDKVIVTPKTIQPKSQMKEANPNQLAKVNSVKKMPKAEKKIIEAAVKQTRYTVQLMAGHNQNVLKRFAALHHLTGKTKIRRMKNNGGIWYVLTFGEYPNSITAKKAAEHLPKEIAQYKPWVRTITDSKS